MLFLLRQRYHCILGVFGDLYRGCGQDPACTHATTAEIFLIQVVVVHSDWASTQRTCQAMRWVACSKFGLFGQEEEGQQLESVVCAEKSE